MRKRISKRKNKKVFRAGDRVRAINTKLHARGGERL